MAANTAPIFSIAPNITANNSTTWPLHAITATGDFTGVSANHVLVFTAGSNGGYVQRIRFVAEGSNTASVGRIYINNGTDHTTATNNTLYGQASLPSITTTDTSGTQEIDYPMNIAIPAGYCIWVGLGTTVAAGWRITCIGGNY